MPRNKYPEQTVEKILDAAALLFTQKGYQNTTLQDIIDATKLSKGAVYQDRKSTRLNSSHPSSSRMPSSA